MWAAAFTECSHFPLRGYTGKPRIVEREEIVVTEGDNLRRVFYKFSRAYLFFNFTLPIRDHILLRRCVRCEPMSTTQCYIIVYLRAPQR